MLNVHPPARTAPAGEPVERSAEFVSPGWADATPGKAPPFDIGTGDAGWLAGRQFTRYLTAPPGAVTVDGRKAGADGARAPSVAEVTARGLDPLSARLVFLSRRYRDDLDLSWEGLFAAGKTLLRWRERVAEWALSPSAAMARRYADAISAAFEDDLDTPAALDELHALEGDADVPDGAKFETFAAMDRLLGLDLARDIGRVTAARQP
jgi:cysteinyl-tRNA synthetase